MFYEKPVQITKFYKYQNQKMINYVIFVEIFNPITVQFTKIRQSRGKFKLLNGESHKNYKRKRKKK